MLKALTREGFFVFKKARYAYNIHYTLSARMHILSGFGTASLLRYFAWFFQHMLPRKNTDTPCVFE
jgi:hypothetical protein